MCQPESHAMVLEIHSCKITLLCPIPPFSKFYDFILMLDMLHENIVLPGVFLLCSRPWYT